MCLPIVVLLLSIWLLVGLSILHVFNIGDYIQRGLLAPAVGMAAVTLVTTTASFVGLPIERSMFVVVAVLLACLVVLRRLNWRKLRVSGLLHLLIVVANIATVGIGLMWYGADWQGLINGDAATNSLAAQYFSGNAFLSIPSVQSIASGLDYSPLSSQFFVWGGSRFGDVMLLGLSANIVGLTPDQVYMAHGLAIRCALIAVTLLLIYGAEESVWELVFATACLTIGPLFAYMYLNQLISQSGGLVLIVAAAVLLSICVPREGAAAGSIVPSAIVIAALSQYYPESLAFLMLAVFLFLLSRLPRKDLPPRRVLIRQFAILFGLVVVLLNVSLPNVFAHAAAVLKWGASTTESGIDPVSTVFDYAFSPDFPAILLGFQTLREGLADPWTTVLQVFASIVLGGLTVFAFFRRQRFPLLISLCAATVVAFLFLFVKRNGFGTFKVMLLAQPLIFVLLAAMLYELVRVRRYWGLLAVSILGVLLGRTSYNYVELATRPLGAVPYMAQHRLLQKLSAASAASPDGLVVDVANLLNGQFAVLRNKAKRTSFEENFSIRYASARLRQVLRTGAAHEAWLPNHEIFWRDLHKLYKTNYETEVFRCFPKQRVEFDVLRYSDARSAGRLLSGGALIPLNRGSLADEDYAVVANDNSTPYLAFRPSTLGGQYGSFGAVSLYNLEADPLINGASMAAVGRYMLLEIIAPSDDDFRLAVKFTRTFLGGTETKLPQVVFYGASPVKTWSAGAGAMSIVSEPVSPCVIAGRKFVLVDFGVDSAQLNKIAPFLYQWFGVQYLPDFRNLVGFLRDISVVPARPARTETPTQPVSEPWNYDRFESTFDFSGMFEDGWVSDQLLLRQKAGAVLGKISLLIDIPGGITGQTASAISIEVDGKLLRTLYVSPGSTKIEIDLQGNPTALVRLSAYQPILLPGGDGRSVIGLLRSIEME